MSENYSMFHRQEGYGTALWHALCRHYNWEPSARFPISEQDIELAKLTFSERRNDRSQALKKASLNRSNPYFSDMLTAKSQWKMKDLDFPVAKPLQTILVRSDAYLFKLGWVGVYLLDRILADLPPYIYWHAKKTPQDYANWARTYFAGDRFTMVDVSGFDASVRGEAVHLMVRLMRRYSIPEDLIDYYVHDKMDFHTKSMAFAIMTFSGELFTWLCNTVKTAAKEALKYSLVPGDAEADSGDDVARAGTKTVSDDWHEHEEEEIGIEKRYEADFVEFCSYKTVKGITFKDPILLFKRLLGKLSMGDVDNIALGYLDQLVLAYSKGDEMYSVMNETELEHHSAVTHIMFNLKKWGYTGPKIDYSRLHIELEDRGAPTIRETNRMLSTLQTVLADVTPNFQFSDDSDAMMW